MMYLFLFLFLIHVDILYDVILYPKYLSLQLIPNILFFSIHLI